MHKVFLSVMIVVASSVSFAGTPRTVGEHVRFAIQNQISTFKLEKGVDTENTVELSTCVAIGEFKQEINKIYELSQIAFLTGEMSEDVRTKAAEVSNVAYAFLPFCGINLGSKSQETYPELVKKAKAAVAALKESVK